MTGRYCWRTRLKNFVIGGFTEPVGEQSESKGQRYNLTDDSSKRTNLWGVRELKEKTVDFMG